MLSQGEYRERTAKVMVFDKDERNDHHATPAHPCGNQDG
jgi:hypothetical protein